MKDILSPLTRLLLSLAVVVITGTAAAQDLPSEASSGAGHKLLLNGTGLRKATIFGIKVYLAGLYVSAKSTDAETIINSADEKQLHMKFLRAVDKEDIADAWREGFHNNNQNAALYENDLAALLASAIDIKEGDTLVLAVQASGARLAYPNGFAFQTGDPAFGKALLRIWLGPKPPNQDLKSGLLGLTP